MVQKTAPLIRSIRGIEAGKHVFLASFEGDQPATSMPASVARIADDEFEILLDTGPISVLFASEISEKGILHLKRPSYLAGPWTRLALVPANEEGRAWVSQQDALREYRRACEEILAAVAQAQETLETGTPTGAEDVLHLAQKLAELETQAAPSL